MDELRKSALKLTYEGIVIEYLEDANVWRFELRGRERRADTLAKAKEAIDKPVKEKPVKEFERFQAHLCAGYMGHDHRQVVTVTSIADSKHAWITKEVKQNYGYGNNFRMVTERSREDINRLYAITPENRKLWEEYDELGNEIKKLEAKRTAVLKRIKNIDVTPWLQPEAD